MSRENYNQIFQRLLQIDNSCILPCLKQWLQSYFFLQTRNLCSKQCLILSSQNLFFFTLQTRTPSAPRNAISNVNETSVFLNGFLLLTLVEGKDVSYYIACKCNSHAGVCVTSVAVMSVHSPANRPEKHLCHGGGSARSHKLYLWDWGSEWSVRLEPRSPAVCVCKCNHKSSR